MRFEVALFEFLVVSIRDFSGVFVLVLRVRSTRTRRYRSEWDYEYHFIEYEYEKSLNIATSKLAHLVHDCLFFCISRLNLNPFVRNDNFNLHHVSLHPVSLFSALEYAPKFSAVAISIQVAQLPHRDSDSLRVWVRDRKRRSRTARICG